jgi:hypothetical protein
LFSVERTENNKKQALRASGVKKYRVAIDFFFCRPLNGKKKVSFLCAFCAFAVIRENAFLTKGYFKEQNIYACQ